MPTPLQPRQPREDQNSFEYFFAAAVMIAVALTLLNAAAADFMLAILLLP